MTQYIEKDGRIYCQPSKRNHELGRAILEGLKRIKQQGPLNARQQGLLSDARDLICEALLIDKQERGTANAKPKSSKRRAGSKT